MANVRPQPFLKSGSFTNNRKVASSSNTSRQLTLNFSPIVFEDREVSIGVTPYQSKEQLQALRLEHADTHVFHRDNSNQILSISTTPEGAAFGEATVRIKLSENLQLCATLARAAIVKFLHRLNRKVLGYKPIEFISDLLTRQ